MIIHEDELTIVTLQEYMATEHNYKVAHKVFTDHIVDNLFGDGEFVVLSLVYADSDKNAVTYDLTIKQAKILVTVIAPEIMKEVHMWLDKLIVCAKFQDLKHVRILNEALKHLLTIRDEELSEQLNHLVNARNTNTRLVADVEVLESKLTMTENKVDALEYALGKAVARAKIKEETVELVLEKPSLMSRIFNK